MRQILTSIRLALSALLRSKIRSALTSLGILIGIAAVLVESVDDELRKLCGAA